MRQGVHFYNLALQKDLAEKAELQAKGVELSFTAFVRRSIRIGLFLLAEQERGAQIIYKDGQGKETEIKII